MNDIKILLDAEGTGVSSADIFRMLTHIGHLEGSDQTDAPLVLSVRNSSTDELFEANLDIVLTREGKIVLCGFTSEPVEE